MTPKQLKSARESLGLGPVDMARLLNTTYPTYYTWSSGISKITGPTARLVEMALKHPETAFHKAGLPYPPTEKPSKRRSKVK